MPEILGHVYDEAEEHLEVRFMHPKAGKVIRIYRHFPWQKYEQWRSERFDAREFFASFMDEHDEEHLLHS